MPHPGHPGDAPLSPLLLALLLACAEPTPAAPPPPVPFSAASGDIDADGWLAIDATCAGADRSPPVTWDRPPAGTRSLALVVSSRQGEEEVVHWTAWDIDPAAGALPAGARPGALPLQGVVSGGGIGWAGPCGVAPGTAVRFDLAALSEVVAPPPVANAAAARGRFGRFLLGLARFEARVPEAP